MSLFLKKVRERLLPIPNGIFDDVPMAGFLRALRVPSPNTRSQSIWLRPEPDAEHERGLGRQRQLQQFLISQMGKLKAIVNLCSFEVTELRSLTRKPHAHWTVAAMAMKVSHSRRRSRIP
jgi:hypothetical protein